MMFAGRRLMGVTLYKMSPDIINLDSVVVQADKIHCESSDRVVNFASNVNSHIKILPLLIIFSSKFSIKWSLNASLHYLVKYKCQLLNTEVWNSQGSVTTYLRCGRIFSDYFIGLQVYCRVCQWKNFEDPASVGSCNAVMKHWWLTFWTPGVCWPAVSNFSHI